jgi:DNA-binding NarL/FixJ family response regulator
MTRPFTAREREVAALIAASRTTKQIAAYLHLDESRVRHLIASVAAKIEADTTGTCAWPSLCGGTSKQPSTIRYSTTTDARRHYT